MARRNFSNTATNTTLAGSINSSVTSLTVASASGYPTAPFAIRCESELILVGVKTGTTFSSLTRGYDGTTAVAHTLGATVEHRIIANDVSFRWNDRVTDKTSTHASTDDFDNDSLDAAWVQVTPTGTVTWTESRDVLSAKYKNQLANDCAGLVKPLGGLSYPVVLTTAIRSLIMPSYNMAGLLFSNGATTGSTVIWAMPFQEATWGFTNALRTGTFADISGIITTERRPILFGGWLYQRLIWRAVNTWSYEISPDGVSWTDYDNGNETFALTPTHFGFGVSSWAQTLDQISTFEYFDISTTLP